MAGFRDHEEFDAWQLANELRTRMRHMKEAEACGYTTPAETAELIVLAKRARGAATGLIQYLEHAKPPKAQRNRRRPRSPSEDD